MLKRVLCRWSNMTVFFNMKMFNSIIILKIRKLLTIDRKCTPVGTIPITWWYSSNHWHLPQMNCLLPFAPTHISSYQTLHFWQHTQLAV